LNYNNDMIMKNLFPYLTLLTMTAFGVRVSLYWDIPVDNQIGMFLLSCMCFGLVLILLFEDIKGYIKQRRNKPTTF